MTPLFSYGIQTKMTNFVEVLRLSSCNFFFGKFVYKEEILLPQSSLLWNKLFKTVHSI